MQARRPLVILIGATAPVPPAAAPSADEAEQSILARRFAEVLQLRSRGERERERRSAARDDDDKPAATEPAVAGDARAQTACTPPKPDETKPDERPGEPRRNDERAASERTADAGGMRRDSATAPPPVAAPAPAQRVPSPATQAAHGSPPTPGLAGVRELREARHAQPLPRLAAIDEPAPTSRTASSASLSPDARHRVDTPLDDDAAPATTPTPAARTQQSPADAGDSSAGDGDANDATPDTWTRAMAEVLASLHHRAVPSAQGWTVTLPADPVVLPESCLRIEVSPHWMSLRFTTNSPESHRLLSTHAKDLVRTLEKELGGKRQIDLEIA